MIIIIYTIAGYLFGSIMFAFFLGKLFLKTDIRAAGQDRNPGTVNLWKSGGWRVGLPAGILDCSKGFAPVFLAQYASGLSGWALVPIAISPLLGHAFSPWLHFRGGKALAAAFGMWAALTNGFGFLAFAGTIGIFWALQDADAWSTALGHFGLLAYLLLFAPQPYLLVLWILEASLVTWKHRHDLRQQSIRLRSFSLR